jgi:hypothetical protein
MKIPLTYFQPKTLAQHMQEISAEEEIEKFMRELETTCPQVFTHEHLQTKDAYLQLREGQ